MNFTAQAPRFSDQLPRIGLVATLHVLGLVLIVGGVRHQLATPEKPPIILTQPEPERPKPPEVTPPPQPQKPIQPQDIIIPPPEVHVTQPPAPSGPPAKIDDGGKFPPIHDGGTGTTPVPTPVPKPHVPLHVAAVVDARNCAKPDYPTKAARLGQAGTVTLAMLVGVDGRVIDAKVDKTSGYKELDLAAREGLSLCKFKPGTIDGVAQQLWTKIQYQWTIDE